MGKSLQQISLRLYQNNSSFRRMAQLTEYMEISDPDRILSSSNDGGMCEAPYDLLRVRDPSTAPYTHPVYRAFPNEASFRGHPLYSRHQQHDEVPIRFPEGRYTLHTTHGHQQESDLTFLRNFRTASNVCRPERQTPYIMTNVFAPLELTDPGNLIPSVASPVRNRSMGLPFTAPIVPNTCESYIRAIIPHE